MEIQILINMNQTNFDRVNLDAFSKILKLVTKEKDVLIKKN